MEKIRKLNKSDHAFTFRVSYIKYNNKSYEFTLFAIKYEKMVKKVLRGHTEKGTIAVKLRTKDGKIVYSLEQPLKSKT